MVISLCVPDQFDFVSAVFLLVFLADPDSTEPKGSKTTSTFYTGGIMETCKLCGKETDSLAHEAEQMVIKMIKNANPDWVETDGACPQCVKHYEELENTVQFKNDPE